MGCLSLGLALSWPIFAFNFHYVVAQIQKIQSRQTANQCFEIYGEKPFEKKNSKPKGVNYNECTANLVWLNPKPKLLTRTPPNAADDSTAAAWDELQLWP